MGVPDTRKFLYFLPGSVILKARTTVIVHWARIVETATVNTIPNVICCKIQVVSTVMAKAITVVLAFKITDPGRK